MGRQEQGRFGNLISKSRELVEPAIRFGLERWGFVRVKEGEDVVGLRLLTQKSLWALKGLDYLFDLPPRPRDPNRDIGVVPLRLFNFKRLVEDNRWQEADDPQMRGVLRRMMSVSSRRRLLEETLGQAFSFNLPPEMTFSARERLETMLKVIAGQSEKPKGQMRAMILTQTAYLIGKGEREISWGFDSWLDFGIKIGGGALPYLGAAVVYSELMNTGQFGQIEIADFQDEEAIRRLIEEKDKYDLVLVSGATTYDTFLIDDLNRRLSTAGLKVINGGIGATISVNPERYLENGASVFIGEFEGAAEAVLAELEVDRSPTIFIRGRETAWGRELRERGAKVTFLENLSPLVDMKEMYSVERERKGYLARRLEALELMKPTATFAGVEYDHHHISDRTRQMLVMVVPMLAFSASPSNMQVEK